MNSRLLFSINVLCGLYLSAHMGRVNAAYDFYADFVNGTYDSGNSGEDSKRVNEQDQKKVQVQLSQEIRRTSQTNNK